MSKAIVSEGIIVVNAGSTSLKFGAYAVNAYQGAAVALPRPDRQHGK